MDWYTTVLWSVYSGISSRLCKGTDLNFEKKKNFCGKLFFFKDLHATTKLDAFWSLLESTDKEKLKSFLNHDKHWENYICWRNSMKFLTQTISVNKIKSNVKTEEEKEEEKRGKRWCHTWSQRVLADMKWLYFLLDFGVCLISQASSRNGYEQFTVGKHTPAIASGPSCRLLTGRRLTQL